ncbi:unnamed protein product, partial [Phaeothamnion confervicola]
PCLRLVKATDSLKVLIETPQNAITLISSYAATMGDFVTRLAAAAVAFAAIPGPQPPVPPQLHGLYKELLLAQVKAVALVAHLCRANAE